MPRRCLHSELKYQTGLRKTITLWVLEVQFPQAWGSFQLVVLPLPPASSGPPLLALATHLSWMQTARAACKV